MNIIVGRRRVIKSPLLEDEMLKMIIFLVVLRKLKMMNIMMTLKAIATMMMMIADSMNY